LSDVFILAEEDITMADKNITVTCPKCGAKITNPSSWFKKPGSCCPSCQVRCSTERFKRCIEEAEKLA
jgi:peptide subunit release factor 1 (eRF1)